MIDKNLLKDIRLDANRALKDVADKYNLDLSIGNASFDNEHATFKLNVSVLSDTGNAITQEWSDYRRHCVMFALKPDWLGETVESGGDIYRVIGLKPRSRKYPVIMENQNHQRYKFSGDMVRGLFNGRK